MPEVLYSVVVPVYNSSGSLKQLAGRLISFFEDRKLSFELNFIDDYSRDNSWDIIKCLAQNNNFIRGARLKKNYGQLAATTCGICNSKGDFIITIDDDLQFPPEEIEKLMTVMESTAGTLLVLGTPVKKKQNRVRKYLSAILQFGFRYILMPSYYNKNVFTSFRMINRSLLEKKNGQFNVFYLWEINSQVIQCVPVRHLPRSNGKTNYTLQGLVKAYYPVIIFALARIFFFVMVIAFIAGAWFYLENGGSRVILISAGAGLLMLFFRSMLNRKRKIYYEIYERL